MKIESFESEKQEESRFYVLGSFCFVLGFYHLPVKNLASFPGLDL